MDTNEIGLHIFSTIRTTTSRNLSSSSNFKKLVSKTISDLELKSVGEVHHDFSSDEDGYTSIICLTESHLSIHTWPEKNTITLDVFLSNHSRNNADRCKKIHEVVLTLFDIASITTKEILR